MWEEPMVLSCQDPIWEPQSSLFHSQAASKQAMGLFAKGQWPNKGGWADTGRALSSLVNIRRLSQAASG